MCNKEKGFIYKIMVNKRCKRRVVYIEGKPNRKKTGKVNRENEGGIVVIVVVKVIVVESFSNEILL